MNNYTEILKKETQCIQNLIPQLSIQTSWGREKILITQEKALQDLLAYAKKYSPYYVKKLAAIDVNQFRLADLKNIEPLTKRELMAHWDEIVTDPELRLVDASHFLMNQSELSLFKNKYHVTATGGSSGLRGLFAWSVEEFILFVSAFFRYQYRDEFSKVTSNDSLLVAAITSEKPVHLSRFVFTVPLIPQMQFLLLPATIPIAMMIDELNKRQPTHLIGYTTEIYRLAQEALRGKLKIQPRRVSVNSEPLFPDMLITMQKAWSAPVTNMWGSSDAGPHAVSCDQTHHLHLNEDILIVEPVNEQHDPVSLGQEANKVLMTNLFHKTMPLFRYEIDDRMTILEEFCPCGSSFRLVESIKGRSDEGFTYPNNIYVNTLTFESVLFPESSIDEYQVFQTTEGAEVWLIVNAFLDTEKIRKQLVNAFLALGIERPQIEVKIVSHLKRHPETGKLKTFVRI